MTMPPLVDLTCLTVTELVTDYMSAGVMPESERARFELHLYACPWCMTYFKQLEQNAQMLAALADPEPQPEPLGELEARLLARFRDWHAAGAAIRALECEPPRSAPRAQTRALSASPQPARYAFKFLERGARGPISGFCWPLPSSAEPGAWVAADGQLEPCTRGIHAARAHELSEWLHDELWVIELAGPELESAHGVVAARGRLVREIEGWSSGGAARFAQAAVDHATELAAAVPARSSELAPYLASAAGHLPRGNTALAAFCAAMAAARLAGQDHFDQAGYDRERTWQSGWIARELKL